MNIFTAPLKDITYDGVIEFCQQAIAEGINLDYKKDFPQKLEKTIAAFANTYGGVILIGVDDENNRPKPPFEGIKYQDRLEDRVWNIIVDNIYPPIFPEILVCHNNKVRAFVVIRVPQSNETPLAIYNNANVYVRTGNRNKPEELATVEQIEWLIGRRKRSDELRESLYKRAQERYETICAQKKIAIEVAEFTLSLVPLYPQKPLFEVNQIEQLLNQVVIQDNLRRKFVDTHDLPIKRVQDGAVIFYLRQHDNYIDHFEINKFGLFFYKEDLGWVTKTKEGKTQLIKMYLGEMLIQLELAIEALGKFYSLIGYWGLIEVKFSLAKVLGIKIQPLVSKNRYLFEGHLPTIDIEKHLNWSFITTPTAMLDINARKNKIIELGQDIAWSLGIETDENLIRELFIERGRWTNE